jgi:hypothetical protein
VETGVTSTRIARKVKKKSNIDYFYANQQEKLYLTLSDKF